MITQVILDKRVGPVCLEATVKDIFTQEKAFNRIHSKTSHKTSTTRFNFKPWMHAAVEIHNLEISQYSITLLHTAGISNYIEYKIAS